MAHYADTQRFGSRETAEAVEARMAYCTPEAIREDARQTNARRNAEKCDNAEIEHPGFPCNHPTDAQTARYETQHDAAQQERQVRITPAAPVKPASDRSIAFLVSLSAERTPHVAETAIRGWATAAGQRAVSAKIDELKKLPKRLDVDSDTHKAATARHAAAATAQHAANAVPAGRYAVTADAGHTMFIHVDRPTEGKWAGYTFVKLQTGDELQRTSRAVRDAMLAKIAQAGVKEAMLRYGQEIGSCGHCGRTLTNEESRQGGIGPVCRGKLGW